MVFKRGQSAVTNTAEWMHWISKDGRYRVSKSVGKFGQTPSVMFHATVKDRDCWIPVEKHHNRRGNYVSRNFRSRKAAEAACQKHQDKAPAR